METFTAVSAAAQPPDPSKHVRYNQGMVLGRDDFVQEFAFHNGRNEWLLRDLIGYGTASGLDVKYDDSAGKHLVRVTAGTAVSPRGQMIRVCSDQCADLEEWLKDAEVQKKVAGKMAGSSPPADLVLYVTLCFRECPVDKVPIPGEPCRSEDDAMAPSRLKDDFKLELRFDSPEQKEEDALRDLVDWLRQIETVDSAVGVSTVEEVVQAVRDGTEWLTSPPSSPPMSPPDFLYGSPPSSLRIPLAADCQYWRALFRLWVTELRPKWQARFKLGGACCCDPGRKEAETTEECLLLAELRVPSPFGPNWQITGKVEVFQDRRPYLLHLRLLQEWLLCGRSPASPTADFVAHPQGLPKYLIVAAGIIKGDGTPREPTYNNLRRSAVAVVPGVLQLTFDNYSEPLGDHQYIVKVLSVFRTAQPRIFVAFEKFLSSPAGFQLRVINANGLPLTVALLNSTEFMIEVSQFLKT